MSSGSISRRRVGSVSQNGRDSPLPPLDIQSIQMPLNPINALALKTASLSSTRSLYQICSHLRKRLRWVEGFPRFLDQPESAGALDVVSHMVHLFRMGSPLCHLYNLLVPAFTAPGPLYADAPAPTAIKFDYPDFMESHEGVRNWAKRPENAKMCQKYIAVFCMAMKQRQAEGRWHEEMWALHELWGKSNGEDMEAYDTTGFLKVLQTVETMLDHLPDSALSPTTPHTASHMAGQSYDAATAAGIIPLPVIPNVAVPDNAFKSVEELVNSEKSYVQELEILVRCSQEMVDAQLVSTETSHQIFSNLSKILDFHRKFLIKLETEYEPVEESGTTAWAEGRWGRPFVTSEGEFDCYGPYCANYLDAIAIVHAQMPSLMRGQSLPDSERPCLHPERELQAFMIKPIQRITKYGLLLGAILSATAKHEYAHRAELEEGAETIRRVAANIDEATDFKDKQAKVRDLVERVEDWKGHVVEKFGDLYLDDHFTVTKADQPREYHVFLFEKMMLCCKEVTNKKVKTKTKRLSVDRRLALKGRIFVSNIHRATLSEPTGTGDAYSNKLTIAWTVPHRHPSGHAEELEDWFVMTGKHEDVLKKWGDKVMELAVADRKRQDESRNSSHFSATTSHFSSSWAPPTPAAEAPPFGFPPPLPGDDDYDLSGRSTPMSQRRVQSQQMQLPPHGAYGSAEMRTRALTEDQNGPSMMQWRQGQGHGHRHGSEGGGSIHMMPPPPMPRLQSNMSAMSEASFGGGIGMGTPLSATGRPMLGRHPSSSTRLGPAEETDEEYTYGNGSHPRGMTRAPSYPHQPQSSASYGIPPSLRERSASSPNVYGHPSAPYANNNHYSSSSSLVGGNGHASGSGSGPASLMNGQASGSGSGGTAFFNKRMSGKRSSGESHSTETSDSSGPSPATPYSHTAAMPMPVSRQNSGDAQMNGMVGALSLGAGSSASSGTLLLRVKCGDCHFSVSVPLDVTYPMLHQKIAKKVRLFRGSEPASMHIKWVDQDGDEVSLKCDQDVEGMFEEAGELGLPFVTLIAKTG